MVNFKRIKSKFIMQWRIEYTGQASAEENMTWDEVQLSNLTSKSKPILRFYAWEKPSLTYGYFTNPSQHINLERCHRLGWQIAKRPTGGGIIFHAYDLAFAVVIPADHPGYSVNTMGNYAYVNQKIAKAISEWCGKRPQLFESSNESTDVRFCMAKPTQYDLVIEGKKVVGAAQRRTKQGLLHQGSICLTIPPASILDEILFPNSPISKAMQEYSYPLLTEYPDKDPALLIQCITEQFV